MYCEYFIVYEKYRLYIVEHHPNVQIRQSNLLKIKISGRSRFRNCR